jgi:RNA polymerase sigma factor (sigma-70 family)
LQETELIQALEAGQEWAFEKLVHTYQDRVYNTALGFVQNVEDAEDLAQEVFIRVFRNIREFKAASTLGTWIYRITVTSSLDFLRKKKRQKRSGFMNSLFDKGEQWDQPDFYHPGVSAENRETSAVLFKAIRQLPAQQQTAFLLQKTEGLDQAAIAEIMKTSVGAVESLLQRAKANLKKMLSDYYQKHYK